MHGPTLNVNLFEKDQIVCLRKRDLGTEGSEDTKKMCLCMQTEDLFDGVFSMFILYLPLGIRSHEYASPGEKKTHILVVAEIILVAIVGETT